MPAPVPFLVRAATAAVVLLAPAYGHAQLIRTADIANLSLEELGNLRVTSVTLRPERYSDAPASVFVITAEDIRRSGATSLPEALRLAPNLEVARVSATTYAVSARGFQNVINNKMLVLIDGRTLYTSVLSGVLWDAQDVMLDDVERIEVISGPGAALFGADAFSGVINVITRSARDTQGGVAIAGGGRLGNDASLRYGGQRGSTAYRGYLMHIERDNLRPQASHVADAMTKDQAGFRLDAGSAARGFMLSGDAYNANVTGNGAARVHLSGENLLGRWTDDLASGGHLQVRAYYDGSERIDPSAFIDRLHLFDAEAQHDLAPVGAHKIAWGLGYRYALDNTTPSAVVRFIPEDQRLHWASAFAQDEVAFPRHVTLTAGAKVQTSVFTHPELMPDLRLDWKPMYNQIAWVGASRALRTPGRVDRDLFFPAHAPFVIRGGPDFVSEQGDMFEVGYRAEPSRRFTFSIVAFHDKLDDLRGGVPAPGGGAFIGNAVDGTSSGCEAWAILQATPRWRVMAGLLELRQALESKSGSGNVNGPAALGNDPRHTVKLRSSWQVNDAIDLDLRWRYVSALAYLKTVPGYDAIDARLGWRATRDLELSVLGSNLNGGHVGFDEHGFPATIPRAAYVQARLTF